VGRGGGVRACVGLNQQKERALLAAGAADDDTKIMLTMQFVVDDKSIL
jgi:hypothetical protein